MLYYNHVFNTTDLDKPYHVHLLTSNISKIDVYVNKKYKTTISGNQGEAITVNKHTELQSSILELMVVGSRQTYDRQMSLALFKSSMARFIKDISGRYLLLDALTGEYSWSLTSRSTFFFNPYYFSSDILWNKTIGYVPEKFLNKDIWDYNTASQLFLTQEYVVDLDETWSGSKQILDVEPITPKPFDNYTVGIEKSYSFDHYIEELQDLSNGDVITFDNGKEVLEVEVANCSTEAHYSVFNETTRPICYVDIDIVNPNKKITYAKSMEKNTQEVINLSLHSNNIQFNIKRN